jgi:hypothetical protein
VFKFFLDKKKKRVYHEFLTRTPCSINDFIKEYNTCFTHEQFEFVKQARFCIAHLAKIPEENIYPQDNFVDKIGYLPFWDWFDEGIFITLLYSKTGIVFSPESSQNVTNPDLSPEITVKDFIFELLQAAKI